MAYNVFGTPITDETLKGMPEYHDKILTGLDRARVALEMKNAEGKDVNARKFVESLRESYGSDGIMCLIYNATGDAIRFITYCHGDGNLASSPYPLILANGQWGAFFHTYGSYGDAANAFVYEGKNRSGTNVQWMYCIAVKETGWCSTEIRPGGYYPVPGREKVFEEYNVPLNQLKTMVHQAHSNGCSSFASIGCTKSPIFEGIMTLENAWAN